MTEKKTFECLRCEHTFPVDYDAKQIVERSCPKCGSNSVRPQGKPRTVAGSREKGSAP